MTPTEPTLAELRKRREHAWAVWKRVGRTFDAAGRAWDVADRAVSEREQRKEPRQ